MNGLTIAGGIFLMITSILLIILVLCQDSKQPNMSAFTGETDSYLSKNKSRTLEAKLIMITRILVIVLFVASIAMNLIIRYVK